MRSVMARFSRFNNTPFSTWLWLFVTITGIAFHFIWSSGAQPGYTYSRCIPARCLGMGIYGYILTCSCVWRDWIAHLPKILSLLVKCFWTDRFTSLDHVSSTLTPGDAIKLEWFIPGRATLEGGTGFCHQRGV